MVKAGPGELCFDRPPDALASKRYGASPYPRSTSIGLDHKRSSNIVAANAWNLHSRVWIIYGEFCLTRAITLLKTCSSSRVRVHLDMCNEPFILQVLGQHVQRRRNSWQCDNVAKQMSGIEKCASNPSSEGVQMPSEQLSPHVSAAHHQQSHQSFPLLPVSY